MARHWGNKTIDDAVELLKVNRIDALADAVTVLLNSPMVAERDECLGAVLYEHSIGRIGYANG